VFKLLILGVATLSEQRWSTSGERRGTYDYEEEKVIRAGKNQPRSDKDYQ
jgi:hypothetical protein